MKFKKLPGRATTRYWNVITASGKWIGRIEENHPSTELVFQNYNKDEVVRGASVDQMESIIHFIQKQSLKVRMCDVS